MDKVSAEKELEISEIAHRIWLEEGQPDGERLVELDGKMIPLRELHWHIASIEWIYGPDYLRSW